MHVHKTFPEQAEVMLQCARYDVELKKQREFRAAFRSHYREKKAAIEELQSRLRRCESENEQLWREAEELRRTAGKLSDAGRPPVAAEPATAAPGAASAVAVNAHTARDAEPAVGGAASVPIAASAAGGVGTSRRGSQVLQAATTEDGVREHQQARLEDGSRAQGCGRDGHVAAAAQHAAPCASAILLPLLGQLPTHSYAAHTEHPRAALEAQELPQPLEEGMMASGRRSREMGRSVPPALVPRAALPATAAPELTDDPDLTEVPASLPASAGCELNAAAQPGSPCAAATAGSPHGVTARHSLTSVSNQRSRLEAEDGGRQPMGLLRQQNAQPGAASALSSKGWKRKRGGNDNFMPDVLPIALRTVAAVPLPAKVDGASTSPLRSSPPAAARIDEPARGSLDAGYQADGAGETCQPVACRLAWLAANRSFSSRLCSIILAFARPSVLPILKGKNITTNRSLMRPQ